MESCERLTELIESIDNIDIKQKCCIGLSELGGRGIFALCDINIGDIILREDPLLIGLNARKDSKLHCCSVCYKILNKINYVCKEGCSLPVCDGCAKSDRHKCDCDLYRLWKPIDPNHVDRYSLRFLIVARSLFMNSVQKNIIYEMQANTDLLYKNEVILAGKCFKNFPTDLDTLEYFYRIIAVLNTNAFEVIGQKENEVTLRGMYPFVAMTNHICVPNTTYCFDDCNRIVIKAAKFIPKGNEITTSYAKLLWNNISRRLFLSLTKKFICRCKRCEDMTENVTYLSAQLCRNCCGITMPENTSLNSSWKCLTCQNEYDSTHASKMNDFALAAINSKVSGNSIKDILSFINERIPKFCPSSNQLVLEAKLNVIWRMNKSSEHFTKNEYFHKIQYCKDILQILNKLNAGECELKESLIEEIKNTKALINIRN